MNAPAATPSAASRPNLAVEAKARRGCRNNLVGLRVVDAAGLRWTIRSTEWDADSNLTIRINPGGETYLASGFRLLDPWPFKCCRGKLDERGMPRRRKGGGR